MSDTDFQRLTLCAACSGITLERLAHPYWYQHSDSYYALKGSAASCPCCKLISQELQKAIDLTAPPESTDVYNGSIQITLGTGLQGSHARWRMIRVRIGLLDVDQERGLLQKNLGQTMSGMMMHGVATALEFQENETVCQLNLFADPSMFQ
jgi:hypothetical protein